RSATRPPGATSSPAKPPTSTAVRQRDAAVTQEILDLKSRLRHAEDETGELRMVVAELQSWDEDSKHEREGHSFHLRQVEAHNEHLEVQTPSYPATEAWETPRQS
ncbi:hypothetical protein FRC11_006819, partial [Ceratobasidium sp. 423]